MYNHAMTDVLRAPTSIAGRWCGAAWPVAIDIRLCIPPDGALPLFGRGGESSEGGGDGYESMGDVAMEGFVAVGGVMLMCRFGCVR